MNTLAKILFLWGSALLLSSAKNLPTKEEIDAVRAQVKERCADEMAALQRGEKTASGFADSCRAFALADENPACRFLLFRAAFRVYLRARAYEQAVDTLRAMKENFGNEFLIPAKDWIRPYEGTLSKEEHSDAVKKLLACLHAQIPQPEKDAAKPTTRTDKKLLVLPNNPKDGVIPVNFPVNFKGRIRSFLGYELGTIIKLPANPTLDKHGNIILTEKLKKPFCDCSDVELRYSSINHALYSIRAFTPLQKKEMSDEEVTSELNGIAEKLKVLLGGEVDSWAKWPQLFTAQVDKATGQWLMLNASHDEINSQHAPKGTMPGMGWTFSVKLEDCLLQKYQPEADGGNRESSKEFGNTDSKRELSPLMIFGTDEFVEKTEDALSLIRKKSPKSYAIVTNYVSIIQSAKQSGMAAFANPPTFHVGLRSFQSQLSWYASGIVHDAYHSKLYHDYRKQHTSEKVPSEIWTGRDAENACLSVQEDFLKEIDAPAYQIRYVQKMRTIDYFSSPTRDW